MDIGPCNVIVLPLGVAAETSFFWVTYSYTRRVILWVRARGARTPIDVERMSVYIYRSLSIVNIVIFNINKQFAS